MQTNKILKTSWFPINIYHTEIELDFCNTLLQKIEEDKIKWKKGLKHVYALTSGFNGLHQYRELVDLGNVICSSILPIIAQEENFKWNNWKCEEAWVNFYQKDDHADLHDHRQVDYCAVLILEEGNGNLIFSSKDFVERNLKSFETPEDQRINEKKGTLICFPSRLYHSVSKCEKERVTVAFNFTNYVLDRKC